MQLQGRPRGTVCPYVDCMVSVVFFNGLIPTKISSQESDGTKFHQSPLPAVRKCCAVLSDTFAGSAGYPEWQMFSCIVKQKIRSTFLGSLRHHGEATLLEKPPMMHPRFDQFASTSCRYKFLPADRKPCS